VRPYTELDTLFAKLDEHKPIITDNRLVCSSSNMKSDSEEVLRRVFAIPRKS
jgi:hypothetical protein